MLQVWDKSKPAIFQIVQVGAGANGSVFFRHLLQDINTHWASQRVREFDIDLTICDADRVEKKNLRNQLYDDEDIGEYKVVALAERYGTHYGVDVKRVTQYITTHEILYKLFYDIKSSVYSIIPILIGMVDNNRTRQLLDEFFHSDYLANLLYIDAGVEDVDSEGNVESGFGGQIVVGFKYHGEVLLKPVGGVYPNILEDKDSHFPGQDFGCGELIINNPQRSATNKMAAELSGLIMNNLFHTGRLYQHLLNFNARLGGVRPTYIPQSIVQRYEQLKNE